jgi:hypothetical protein
VPDQKNIEAKLAVAVNGPVPKSKHPASTLFAYLNGIRGRHITREDVFAAISGHLPRFTLHMSVEEPPWLFSESTFPVEFSFFVHHVLLA